MADFRQIKCGMWREDDWFLDLPTDGKLLWIYLFSNPSASVAGIYRISLRTMANETGLPVQQVENLLHQFSQANKAHFNDGVMWVVKMREHQATSSDTVLKRLAKDIAVIPKANPVYRMYAARYGIDTVSDTVSIPIHTDTDTAAYRDGYRDRDSSSPQTPITNGTLPPAAAAAFESAEILGVSQVKTWKAWQEVTGVYLKPSDIMAWHRYRLHANKRRTANPLGVGYIVQQMQEGKAAPEDYYDYNDDDEERTWNGLE